MKLEEFKKLNANETINYLNKILKEDTNLGVKGIWKDTLKIDEKTYRKHLNKHNLKYNKQKRIYYIENTNITQDKTIENNIKNTNITHLNNVENDIEIIDNYKDNTNVAHINKIDLEMQQNIIDIMKDAEVLKQMIQQYKNNTTILHQKLNIDLPNANAKHTTMRVNEVILDKFNEFADKNKQYSKIDLVSQALKEFIEKYN